MKRIIGATNPSKDEISIVSKIFIELFSSLIAKKMKIINVNVGGMNIVEITLANLFCEADINNFK